MKTALLKRIVAVLLTAAFLFTCAPIAFAADTDGFRCDKSATRNADGTVSISLRAFQTGSVPAADIVMVLDVSGSMENSTPVPVSEIDGTKDYYIRYVRIIEVDGETKNMRVNVRVHNTAAPGEEPTWFGQLQESGPERQVRPGDGKNGTYQFYTGAMDALRKAAADFVHSIAQNAVQYEADHRVAVVEFSSPAAKGTDALCTHTTQPDAYYANILTGDGTASGALVSAKDSEETLTGVFASLTAAGPTYSDDAMTQARRILSASTADRRVVILFTDGGPGSYGWDYDIDETALPTANGAIAAAADMKQNGAQIYTIGVFNEENLAGTAGENNRKYLSLVSSNYPDAESMDSAGTQQADGYCSIGDLHMDLSGAFAGISAVLGEPVESAQVRDTISKYFYLTDAQRQALLTAYPQAQIVDNDDGSTTVSLDAVDFPPVAIHANGDVANENDAGIFKMTFDVTPREGFLGGKGVSTNSGLCGVFVGGVHIGQFETPAVDVPVSETALNDFLTVTPLTVYTDETIEAQALFTDLSQDAAADYADVSYTVTDPDGAVFTAGSMPASGTYTFKVTMCAVIDAQTFTREKIVDVTVLEDTVDSLEIVTLPEKTRYTVGERVQLDGIEAQAHMRSGRTVTPDAQQLSVSPETLTALGAQTVTLSYGGSSTTFDVTVDPLEPTLTLLTAPDKTTYLYGETLDPSGLSLQYTDSYGDVFVVTEGFTCDPTKLTALGTQTVTAAYSGLSVTFDVTVEPLEPTLTLLTAPDKTTYLCGETLDLRGLSLRYTDVYGDALVVTEGYTCDPMKLTALGTQTVTARYGGLSVTFDVTVEPNTPTLSVRTLPDKTSYVVGGSPDTTGLSLVYTDEYGVAQVVDSGFDCSPTTFSAEGTQTVTVTYRGLSATFRVTVEKVRAESATVVALPDQASFVYRQTPGFSGLTVRVRYNDGHEETVNDLSQMTVRQDSDARVRRGAQTFRVTTRGVSATFTMQVRLTWWQWLILICLFGWIWY